MFKRNKKAFTIVELVIVIAVIAILMGIMFIGGTAINNNAKKSALDSDLRNYEIALKSMVNDPENKSLLRTGEGVGYYLDTVDKMNSNVKTAINKYFEDDMAINASGFAACAGGHKATVKAYEATTKMKDPYGKEYKVVVLDNSDTNHTDISLIVYSYGKNKQTDADKPTAEWDADDLGRVVRVVDSVIYTYDFGSVPAGANAYQVAVNAAFKNAPSGFTPAVGE